MASLFLYHVVGDLTVGKPELSEFWMTETVAAAIRTIGDTSEGGIPVWRNRSPKTAAAESAESRQQRFVGILNALDIVAFLARDECLADQDKALSTAVSHVVVPNSSALKVVDPGTRLIDALEMMKQGVKRLVVPKSLTWRGISKRFSILYNGKWLRNSSNSSLLNPSSAANSTNRLPTSCVQDRFCCLSREDVLRFLIGCLGALAPLPLSSIASLGAVNRHNYCWLEASRPAAEAAVMHPQEPCAVAIVVVDPTGSDSNKKKKIIGEISSAKLWKSDFLTAAWALANLSAAQFILGIEEENNSSSSFSSSSSMAGEGIKENNNNIISNGENPSSNTNNNSKMRKIFSSRSIGLYGNFGMYKGRSVPLTCRETSSLAAVMAQMLSHRATHIWVTQVDDDDDDNSDILVGVVGYADILAAVTAQPAP
ncbi:CBS domain-containing protein CBSX6 [Striga hermonthica]|uniref:CBS domain-containing protein CBSX6 n=1 Tax=Striga hermonthica TaxID=68872 RepID=A0A9N7RCD3_STRHE|nr:CBS domain-containing protein CBSX6 [Striga hermonthica]